MTEEIKNTPAPLGEGSAGRRVLNKEKTLLGKTATNCHSDPSADGEESLFSNGGTDKLHTPNPSQEGNSERSGQKHAGALVEGSSGIDKGNKIKKAARSPRIFG